MKAMSQNQQITPVDWIQTLARVTIYTSAIGIGAVMLLPALWYVWMGIVVGGMWMIIRWHAGYFAYICPKCQHMYQISAVTDFISPNGLTKKYLKCGKCQQWSWTNIIKR